MIILGEPEKRYTIFARGENWAIYLPGEQLLPYFALLIWIHYERPSPVNLIAR